MELVWMHGGVKVLKWVWNREILDDAKRLGQGVGKPLLGDLMVTLLTKGFFAAHDAITGEQTAHWVTNALYIAEQVAIAVYFLAFSFSDILESLAKLVVRTKSTMAETARDIRANPMANAPPVPSAMVTSVQDETLPGFKPSAIERPTENMPSLHQREDVQRKNEDIQQKLGE